MLHSEITFDGTAGPVKVVIKPNGEATSVYIERASEYVTVDADELEHVYRLLLAYRAAQAAAVKALEQ